MIKQNFGKHSNIVKGLKALSKHPFGDHSYCNENWCRFIKDPTLKFMSLPYGRPLKSHALQVALTKVFDSYIDRSETLAHLGSSQANESFNKTVASKAPKSQHYSGSSSLNYRVAASVAQKNLGYSYLVDVRNGAWYLFSSSYCSFRVCCFLW